MIQQLPVQAVLTTLRNTQLLHVVKMTLETLKTIAILLEVKKTIQKREIWVSYWYFLRYLSEVKTHKLSLVSKWNLIVNILEITVDRSCCHPFTGSSACPAEYGDFEVVTTETYTKYYTRCQGELCNDGPGDNSDDADNGGKFIFKNIFFLNDKLVQSQIKWSIVM